MEHRLNTPLKKEDVLNLKAGDVVYLTGRVLTVRDEAHRHILETLEKEETLPFDLTSAIIYHCGPLLQKDDPGAWQVISAGPTTSNRMTLMTPDLLEKTGVCAVIGKGGMKGLAPVFKERCVYLAYTGGCAALAAEGIIKVASVHWLNLGMPEAVWEFEVEDFGPLIVGIDAHGADLYEQVLVEASRHLNKMI